MLKQPESSKLFSSPVTKFKVEDCAPLNAALLMEGEKMRAESLGVSKSNKGGWHSENDFLDRKVSSIQTVKKAAVELQDLKLGKVQ